MRVHRAVRAIRAASLPLASSSGALDDLTLASDPLSRNRYGLAASNPLSATEWDGHSPTMASAGSTAPSPQPSSSGGCDSWPDLREAFPSRLGRRFGGTLIAMGKGALHQAIQTTIQPFKDVKDCASGNVNIQLPDRARLMAGGLVLG